MYLRNGIGSVLIERDDPYLCKRPDNAVEYPEGLKICVLKVRCSLEIRWYIFASGYSRCYMHRKWLHELYGLLGVLKC